jgi:hypothetical protein
MENSGFASPTLGRHISTFRGYQNVYISRSKRVVRNNIFRKALPSVISGYGERSINLNKVVATFEKHTFLSQTNLTSTGIISNSYNEICIYL